MTTTAQGQAGPRLHERDAEIGAIERTLDSVDEEGRSLLIEGPAGIGKSSLLTRAGREAEARGMPLLQARGEELEREFAFGVATQLYGAVITEAADGDPALLSGAAGLARRLLEAPGGSRRAASGTLFEVLHGLHWLTSNLARRRPILIAVDDLQWADPPSLRLLLYLLDRLGDLHVALVATIRSGEPQPPEVVEMLDRMRSQADRSLTLKPLSPDGIAAAVQEATGGADDDFCAAVAHLTAGNPLLVRELLAVARDNGVAPAGADAARLTVITPGRIAPSLSVRMNRLGGDAERLAEAVAVLEPDAPLRRAARLAAIDLDRALAAAHLLEQADILTGPDPLGFIHPLLRSAVSARLSDAQRARRHLEAARLLHADGAANEKVASHLVSAERCDEEWAISALRQAARGATERGSPQSAIPYLRRAAEVCTDRAASGELQVELATALTAAGSPEAADRFDEALTVIAEPRRRAEVLAALAEARYVGSDYAGAIDAFARGLAELDGADESLEARLLAGAGSAAALAPERAEVAAEAIGGRLARMVAEPPEQPNLPERVLLAYAAGRSAASVLADRDRVLVLARRALGEGDPLAELGRIVIEPVAAALFMVEELDEAVRLYTAILDDARERGALATVANVLPMRALCHHRLGSVAAMLTDAEDALRLCAELPSENLGMPTGRAMMAVANLERDDLEAAEQAVDVPDAERRWGFLPVYGVFLTAKARVELAQGRPREALAMMRDGAARMAAAGFINPTYFESGSEAALAAHRLGDEAVARELVEADLELVRRFGAPRGIGMALRALGLIEGGSGGIELLRESVELLRDSPARLDRAQALFDLGAALRRAGERTEARACLEESMELADRSEATALVSRATGELRTLGLRPRRAAVSGPHALTPSERRTATMAAGGMSNREIAQSLFLTLRTVESHLTGAYRKLDITSRKQLPEALAALGPGYERRSGGLRK